MRVLFGLILICVYSAAISQTTLGNEPKPKPGIERPAATKKHKILLVPFEPKMYMSQIDHKINAETKWSQQKIKANFRDGVDEQLYKKLKQHFDVISLLDDTVKYKKDLFKIYQHLTYKYEKVPDQEHYTAPKSDKEKPTIKNGQLVVETNTDARFMNAKITSAALVPELFAKYKTDLFVFINQMDITAGETPASGDFGTQAQRTITLHYTVYTVDAKEINSGTCSVKFPVDVNNPTKIISSYISKIAEEINRRIEKALTPVIEKK